MAKEKKSFLLYCDLNLTVNKLPDEVAGKLFKVILAYVNDENPVVDDLLLQVAFEPVKLQLKRDLKKYEKKKKQWSAAGKASAAKRSTKSTDVEHPLTNDESRSTDSTVTDTDTVIVTDTVTDINSLNLSLEENFKVLESNQIWIEKAQMAFKLTPALFKIAWEAFKAKCIVACDDNSISGLQRYFSNWYPQNKNRLFEKDGKSKSERNSDNKSKLAEYTAAASAIANNGGNP